MSENTPQSLDEYNHRYSQNFRVTGFGLDVTNHFPCPFCAAPDWYVVRLLDFGRDSPNLTCRHCGRSGQLQYAELVGGGSHMRFVQTGGDDAPEWLTPAPQREAPR